MIGYDTHPRRSDEVWPRDQQLACRIAEVAADPVAVTDEVAEMVVNRVIDNAAVAAASLHRAPVVAARGQATAHPFSPGASVFGVDQRCSPEWAAWANGVAVRELDFHDTFLAAEYSHPGDNIPPILAVAQHAGADGAGLIRGIATGYEIQVDLARAISLHAHKINHVAHLGPSAAAGIGTVLGSPVETVFQAVGQALHTTTATRQSRKGEISTWKAYARLPSRGRWRSRRSTAPCVARPGEFATRKSIHPNLDYPSGPAYHLIGFDTALFTPLFVASRVTGWTAHIMEQAAANTLIRPLSAYNGAAERHLPNEAKHRPELASR